ncbi:MAG: VanW family protein [Patescibacteria group bacterium]
MGKWVMMEFMQRVFHTIGWLVSVALLVVVCVMVAYQLAYDKVILPRVVIAGIEVSNMDKAAAKQRLATAFTANPNRVKVVYREKRLTDTATLRVDYDFDWVAQQAWNLGRSGNPLTKISERVAMFLKPIPIDLPTDYDVDAVEGIITRVAGEINQAGKAAEIYLDEAGEVKVETGRDGLMVDEEGLRKSLASALRLPGEQTVEVKTVVDSMAIDSNRVNQALESAKNWKDKSLRLYYKDFSYTLATKQILKLLSLTAAPINFEEADRLLATIKPEVETVAKNAVFNFENGKVIEFSAEVNGVAIEEAVFKQKLAETIAFGRKAEMELSVTVTEAKIKAGDINNLGIKTLIGVGTSKFAHSIPNRVHNLTLASSRLNGALVAPGETFSLGATIGDISKVTGYREAYVISEGRTVLGDGGGVCQVSTTLFRAVLNAGLPVVERKAHVYRVGYYEQDMGPGYDATVFFPSTDLKFVNDTAGHILIQTKVDAKNFSMRYEIYGTGDGRLATISAPKIYSQSPALATVYQDDPTLPVGTLKQVDWSAPGAKVSFDYKVVRNGEILQDRTFTSTYRPWAAVYLKGTGQLTASN